ncbi:putative P-loop containing nucleoside triphosphate hydrolase [Helianthus debilis subsp. tardiflorus]
MVESVMDSVQSYSLKLFSDEEVLSLFAQHASGKQSFNISRILKLHGEDIVKKCGRLPLALKTLWRVFRTKLNVEEWGELLESEIWDLDNGSEILPALMLSYYDLPPHLKQMFVYCCLGEGSLGNTKKVGNSGEPTQTNSDWTHSSSVETGSSNPN